MLVNKSVSFMVLEERVKLKLPQTSLLRRKAARTRAPFVTRYN